MAENVQHHIIKHQVLEVQVPNQRDQRWYSETVLRVFSEQIQGSLARLFDELATPDEHIAIDRLELDLGHLSVDQLEEDFADLFLTAARKQLGEMVQIPGRIGAKAPGKKDTIYPTPGKRLQVLIIFLQTGSLPWWVEIETDQEFEELVIGALSPAARGPLLKVFSDEQVRERAASQFSSLFFERLLQVLLNGISASGSTELLHLLQSYRLASSLPARRVQLLEVAVNLATAARGPAVSIKQAETAVHQFNGGLARDQMESSFAPPLKEEYYVKNAGLVLLWPYLSRFFEKLGLLEADAFVNFKAQQRAVHRLANLATGQSDLPEYELVLCKILCGYPLTKTLPKIMPLTEHEHEEAQQLLLSVIQNWSQLGRTSVDSLQQSFLQREGKLSRLPDGWTLQVEQEAYDILLDHLPWSVSMVHLPWLEGVVWVEWG